MAGQNQPDQQQRRTAAPAPTCCASANHSLHAGAERYVHVYLPPSYDGSTQWPIWVHLHGVFWATMGDIGARVGRKGWCCQQHQQAAEAAAGSSSKRTVLPAATVVCTIAAAVSTGAATDPAVTWGPVRRAMKHRQVFASWLHPSSHAPLVRAVYLQVGHPVNGTDIIPAFDHSVEMLGDKAILVYPQAIGDAGSGAPDEGQGAKYRQVGGTHTHILTGLS